jgi:type IV pilus assembly protein PilW
MILARIRGVGLVELVVALLIGLLLVAAALTVFAQGRSAVRVTESVARIQEQGRYALSVIAADVELAGLLGFGSDPTSVRLVRGSAPESPLATAGEMRQDAAAVPGVSAGAHACGANFALDMYTPVQGSNNGFALGRTPAASCEPYGAGAVAGTDTLVLRRVAVRDSAPEAGRLQMYASRLASRDHFLFFDGDAPGPVDGDHRVLDLVVRAYYVARDSVGRPGFPALRVKSLTRSAGGPAFDEDEVMTGIEDLQVQLGIDTGDRDGDGRIDPGLDPDGDGIPEAGSGITRYVSPDFAGLARYRVGAVRLWLRVRAEEPEAGFVDGRTYRYADVAYTPAGAAAAYRRQLISRTIAVRNARS